MKGFAVNVDCGRVVDRCLFFAQELLYPPTCRLCAARGQPPLDLCRGCMRDLPWLGACCTRCARPLPAPQATCGACLQAPPPYHRTRVALRYAAPVDRLIKRFKFHADLGAGRLLAELLTQRIRADDERLPEVLLPVPLHPRRLRWRGFNQALEVSHILSRRLGPPTARELLRRVRPTVNQHGIDASQRRANVRGAFALTGALPAQHVALIDDVLTTGSTAAELTRLLLSAGAQRVEVWALARAG